MVCNCQKIGWTQPVSLEESGAFEARSDESSRDHYLPLFLNCIHLKVITISTYRLYIALTVYGRPSLFPLTSTFSLFKRGGRGGGRGGASGIIFGEKNLKVLMISINMRKRYPWIRCCSKGKRGWIYIIFYFDETRFHHVPTVTKPCFSVQCLGPVARKCVKFNQWLGETYN